MTKYPNADQVVDNDSSHNESNVLIPEGAWSSLLILKGFELHRYADPKGDLGWSGWVEVGGTLLGFVDEQMRLLPFAEIRYQNGEGVKTWRNSNAC